VSSEPALYERLGGRSGIEAMVDTFYERIMRVDELRDYFALVLAALTAVLKEHGVTPMDRYAIAAKLRTFRDMIVAQVKE